VPLARLRRVCAGTLPTLPRSRTPEVAVKRSALYCSLVGANTDSKSSTSQSPGLPVLSGQGRSVGGLKPELVQHT